MQVNLALFLVCSLVHDEESADDRRVGTSPLSSMRAFRTSAWAPSTAPHSHAFPECHPKCTTKKRPLSADTRRKLLISKKAGSICWETDLFGPSWHCQIAKRFERRAERCPTQESHCPHPCVVGGCLFLKKRSWCAIKYTRSTIVLVWSNRSGVFRRRPPTNFGINASPSDASSSSSALSNAWIWCSCLPLAVALLPRPHEGRPPLPVGRDGLDRSFVHGATGSVELYSWSEKSLSNDSELMEMDEASG